MVRVRARVRKVRARAVGAVAHLELGLVIDIIGRPGGLGALGDDKIVTGVEG